MKHFEDITLFFFVSAALYLFSVSVSVANRMNKKTHWAVRMSVVLIGTLASWSILRAFFETGFAPEANAKHAAAVVSCALILLLSPRIPT